MLFCMIVPPPADTAQPVAEIRFGLAMLTTGILLLAGAIAATDFVAAPALMIELVKLLLLFGCAWRIMAAGLRRTGMLFGAIALFAGLSGTAALLSTILAASARPYADTMLAGADAWLLGDGFAAGLIRVARQHSGLLSGLSCIYELLNFQPVFLILCLSHGGDPRRLIRFINAWGIALAISLLIFPFVPAVGFYLHHAIPFASMPGLTINAAWSHLDILAGFRSGAMRTIDGQTFCGIVTFPSFHATGAVLLAWGFRHHRRLRWPILPLNIAMIVSAIFVGGHYVVDLIGGAVVALLAIRLSGLIAVRPPLSRSAPGLFPAPPDPLWLR